MATWTALTHTKGREAAEALAEAGEDLTPEPVGSGVFEIEDGSDRWEVGLYFTEAPDEVGLALLAAAWDAPPFAVSELPEVDWVAHVRRELTPVEAGRFFVHGGHDADKVPEGAEALLIEAAMAFGTGHHATTKGCLLALDRMIAEGAAPRRIVDVGCGTGQLTALLAQHFRKVVGIDPSAEQLANASQHPLVEYAQAHAESLPLPNDCANLVVAAQAAHWFELPRFYREVRRIARKPAALALVSYGAPRFEESNLQDRFARFYEQEIGPFWPPERRLVDQGYATIDFPFPEFELPLLAI